MDLFLAISQGTGLALATGSARSCRRCWSARLRVPTWGVDFSGTDFAFLESSGFLVAMVALTAMAILVGRRTSAPIVVRALWR